MGFILLKRPFFESPTSKFLFVIYFLNQDIKDGGACKTDASGLPDANCIFFATHDTMAESSYMALPYLTSVTDFCDATGKTVYKKLMGHCLHSFLSFD